jgi:uncharacterized protein YxjI
MIPQEGDVRYVIKQKVLALRDSFAIRDASGEKVFRVKGKLISVGDKLTFRSADGTKVASIRQKVVSLVPRYRIRRDGKLLAEVKKKHISVLKAKFKVRMQDGSPDLQIVGNLLDHEYSVRRGDAEVARITKKWVSFGDSYGVQVDKGEDDVLILACAIVVDMICHEQSMQQRQIKPGM